MCEYCFFAVWFSGWIFGLGLFCAVLCSVGVSHLNTDSEDTREGKIERFCNHRQKWDDDGWKTLNDFDFYVNITTSSASIKCQLSDQPVVMNKGVDGHKMTDGKCGSWKHNVVRCGPLDQLVPYPEMEQDYRLMLRSQRKLLSRTGATNDVLTTVGDLTLKVGHKKTETISHATSKNCNKACATRSEQSTCFKANGVVTSRGDNTRCLTSYRLWNPCLVIAAVREDQDASKPVSSFVFNTYWKQGSGVSRSASRCEKPKTSMLERDGHQNVHPNTPEDWESLKAVVEQREIVFRVVDDPLVEAARMTDGEFDMGWSEAQLVVMGVIMIIIGICFGCCSCGCFVACLGMAANGCE